MLPGIIIFLIVSPEKKQSGPLFWPVLAKTGPQPQLSVQTDYSRPVSSKIWPSAKSGPQPKARLFLRSRYPFHGTLLGASPRADIRKSLHRSKVSPPRGGPGNRVAKRPGTAVLCRIPASLGTSCFVLRSHAATAPYSQWTAPSAVRPGSKHRSRHITWYSCVL